MKFWMTLTLSLLVLSCAHKEKDVLVTATPPPEEKVATPVATPGVGTMNADLKGYKQLRAAGMVHFVAAGNVLRVEVMLEGMKPGPYKVNLNSSKKCKNANSSHGRDIGEVIADSKGTAKASFDLNDMPTSEVKGKKIIIYTKEKRHTYVAACGVVETI